MLLLDCWRLGHGKRRLSIGFSVVLSYKAVKFSIWFVLQCSVSCGLGEKQRTVECSDQDFSCNARDKPQTSARCNPEPCPQWTVGPWGEVNIKKSCYFMEHARG